MPLAPKPQPDRLHLIHGGEVVPHACPVCVKCWMVVSGPSRGHCVHQGPYNGYVEVPDERGPPKL